MSSDAVSLVPVAPSRDGVEAEALCAAKVCQGRHGDKIASEESVHFKITFLLAALRVEVVEVCCSEFKLCK